jgi:hypothetical protein
MSIYCIEEIAKVKKTLKEFIKYIGIALVCKNKPRVDRSSSSIAKEKHVKKVQTLVTQRPPQ